MQSFGVFVALENGCEGLIRAELMTGDFYQYDEEHMAWSAAIPASRFTIGTPMRVKLLAASDTTGQIDFHRQTARFRFRKKLDRPRCEDTNRAPRRQSRGAPPSQRQGTRRQARQGQKAAHAQEKIRQYRKAPRVLIVRCCHKYRRESFMSNKVTVAAIQMTYGLEEACEKVREAASQGAQIILLPELFENWYFCQEKSYENYHLATTLEENPAVREMQTIARDFKVVIPVSYYERVGETTFNTVAVIDADGTIMGQYRKTHIPDDHFYQEKFYFTPGNTGFKVWDNGLCENRRRYLLVPVVPGICVLHGIAGC